jgi:hypothetical protein
MTAFPPGNSTQSQTAIWPEWQDPAAKPKPAIFIVEFRNPRPLAPWKPFGETDSPAWAKEILQACRNFFPSCESRLRRRAGGSENLTVNPTRVGASLGLPQGSLATASPTGKGGKADG